MPQWQTSQLAISTPTEEGEFFIPDLCAPRSVLMMVLLTELLVLVYTLASSSILQFNWGLLGLSSIFVLWVVLLSAGLLCQLRAFISRLRLGMAIVACLFLVALITAISSMLALSIYPDTTGSEWQWWVLRNVIIAVVLSGMVLRYFFLRQQLRMQEQAQLRAHLDSLRARIRPHFLFNTLNSIASLIMSRPEAAEVAVEDLAELFRASLQESRRDTTVADELRLCELYLGIEKLRLGERLDLCWQVDESLHAELMPSLLIQPLVENAVYHGVAQLPEGGKITVSLQRDNGYLRVEVANPTPDVSSPSRPGHQLGLPNIQQRLQATFGGAAEFAVAAGDGQFTVRLAYPLDAAQ